MQELDLKSRTDAERLEETPRAVIAHVMLIFLAPRHLELRHETRDVLRPGFVGNEKGILGFDDNEILHADRGDKGFLATDVTARRILDESVAVDKISVAVSGSHVPQ